MPSSTVAFGFSHAIVGAGSSSVIVTSVLAGVPRLALFRLPRPYS